jgi:hypothetical protein
MVFAWPLHYPALMRSLGKPAVLQAALVAGVGSALACWPRVATAPHQHYPLWYLEAVVLLASIVLWGFVFAWHTQYTQRPVFTLRVEGGALALATVAGVAVALFWHFVLDSRLRAQVPEDYPATTEQWLAMTLFSLGLRQLFLIFAPFAWLVRLFGKRQPAFVLTVVFAVAVLLVRNYRSPAPLPSGPLLGGLLVAQSAAEVFSLYLFLRGGVLLVWWWTLLCQSRLLLS